MALNYQRNSYTLREAALASFQDPTTQEVFDLQAVVSLPIEQLRAKLLLHKLALQPNKHISTRRTIAETVVTTW
ncbi:MAG: hypothetical protein H6765_11280 [Candidatus Peribacteria bacterium]|nr:MAG: hypothetical protein H6765_11280 [Candidatus Peribacteria bacterium]